MIVSRGNFEPVMTMMTESSTYIGSRSSDVVCEEVYSHWERSSLLFQGKLITSVFPSK